jgi:hypothetical protein
MKPLDFKSDLYEQARSTLLAEGFGQAEVAAITDPMTVLFEYRRRQVAPLRRVVRESTRMGSNPQRLTFSSAIEEIKRLSNAGLDLSPYQSRRMEQAQFNDRLLNDWGIHHFHLGTSTDPDGYITRTGPLLFALVTADTLYLLDIMHHGSFVDVDLIEIIHGDWPEVIDSWRYRAPEPAPALTPEQRKNIRKNGVNVRVQVSDGTTYLPPGGGQMVSGASTAASVCALTVRVQAAKLQHQMEQALRQNAATCIAALGCEPHQLDIHLIFEHGIYYIVENFTKRILHKYDPAG